MSVEHMESEIHHRRHRGHRGRTEISIQLSVLTLCSLVNNSFHTSNCNPLYGAQSRLLCVMVELKRS
jgi:hypothetical protein